MTGPQPSSQRGGQAAASGALLARFVHYSGAILSEDSGNAAAQVIVRRVNELLPAERALLIRTKSTFKLVTSSAGHSDLTSGELLTALKSISKQHKSDAITTFKSGESFVFWLPVRSENSATEYVLWLERSTPWLEAEQSLANRLLPFMRSALFQHTTQQRSSLKGATLWLSSFVLAAIVLAWPVQLSAVASAEVVAAKPAFVYAPLNAVLERVLVKPGDVVTKGQPLLEFDKQLLEQQVNEARENVAVELAELNRLERAGFSDNESRAALPVQKLKIGKAKAALNFQLLQLNRASLTANQAGVVVMPEASSLEGAAVQLGQQLFSIADPSVTELLLKVPVKDRGIFKKGASVKLRLDSAPLDVIGATATRAEYDISTDSGEHPVVEVRASWESASQSDSLLGQRGSARIYGERSHFGWQLVRKPLLAALDILGY